MYKNEINRLHDIGIYNDEERDGAIRCMEDDPYVDKNAVAAYYLKFNPKRHHPVDILKQIDPWHDCADVFPDLFGKYGFVSVEVDKDSGDIYDSWKWFDENNLTKDDIDAGKKVLEDASECELWKMIAISRMYLAGIAAELSHDRERRMASHLWSYD